MRMLKAAFCWLLLLPATLPAVGSSGETIVIVADSRRFTGWKAWWTNLYNESHALSAILTILILPAIALILGRVTGALMAAIGINLKSRELAEH
jgi:hypothetical protein